MIVELKKIDPPPKLGQSFFLINSHGDIIEMCWTKSKGDLRVYKFGMWAYTYEDCRILRQMIGEHMTAFRRQRN